MESGEREHKVDLSRLQEGVGVERRAGGGGDQHRRCADEVLRRRRGLSGDLAGGDGGVEELDVAVEVDDLDFVGGGDGGGWTAGETATHLRENRISFSFGEDEEERGVEEEYK